MSQDNLKNVPRGPAGGETHRAGFAAIVGAPNVGKSSLLNRYLGQKVSIVSPKPQTTRGQILGAVNEKNAQIIFCDTPGIHLAQRALGQGMEARTLKALKEADLCLWLIDGANFGGAEHRKAAEIVKNAKGPPLLAAVNKCDLLSPKESQRLTRQIAEEVAPDYCAAVSVKTGRGLEELKKALIALLPPGPPLYDQDWLTDQSLRELAVEFVREAVFKYSRQEIPYQTAVTVEKFTEPEPEDPNPIYRLWATVHVEKEAQKKILVGQGGSTIKKIGTEARLNMEEILEAKLFLNLFVKVSPSWSSNPRLLAEFGYKD